MKKNLPGIAFAFLVVSGCGNANDNKAADNKQPGTTKESGHTPNTNAETSGTRIRNNIELNTRDLQVSQAFLIYEDGKLVPESNEASVGQPVRLRLVVEGGWKENNGSVSLGAAERIETNDGLLVVDEKDLFASTANISAQDARLITLTATISQVDKLYDYFLVSCRVWDKNGPGEVTASYRLFIK